MTHAHNLLYGTLLLAVTFVLLGAMVWDVCWRQPRREALLDELWDDEDGIVRCECGATELVLLPGVVATGLVCPQCPNATAEPSRPVLKLVTADGDFA